ncbi:MAG: bifunctional hydroxymethylpyrimidine kinase/phosphomethylpyrimidine kinase [Vicinamibacterales bacterium]
MTRLVKTALTIAGSDSGGGAGIQADLKTFAALGVFGTSAITAITAQNTVGVIAAQALPADLVTAQIEAVASDIHVSATKTGMLASAAIVEAVAAAISDLQLPLVVVDPVMVAKSGDRLLDEDALTAIRGELLRRALVVTPNIPEAEVLSGLPIASLEDAKAAAKKIHAFGPTAVVVKGGHAPGDELVDLLFDGRTFHEFRTVRIDTRNTHGTGCTFASAIAARLALGDPLVAAVGAAQAYVAGAIRHGLAIGHGHGPLDHFWNSRANAG